ncbi:unnamed protein product [Effrenium voratum]|uniref:Uncharacterized protein n=1 Tax=Effrenium voratum TaxID=2562239 RepID=A0AA36JHM8_9DINO|nr:unnamed protein product [Effrenium voratum]
MRLVVRAAPWALALGSAYGAECDGGLVAHCIVGHEAVYESILRIFVQRAAPLPCSKFFYVLGMSSQRSETSKGGVYKYNETVLWESAWKVMPPTRYLLDPPPPKGQNRMTYYQPDCLFQCIHMFDKVRLCLDLVREHEQDTGERFSWILRSRPDLLWDPETKLPPLDQLAPTGIYTPRLADGLQDSICKDPVQLVPRNFADLVFESILDRCLLRRDMAGRVWNCDAWIERFCAAHGIPIFELDLKAIIRRLPNIHDGFHDYHDQWHQHVRFATDLLPDSIYILGNEDSRSRLGWSNWTRGLPADFDPQEGCTTVADSQFCMPVNAYLMHLRFAINASALRRVNALSFGLWRTYPRNLHFGGLESRFRKNASHFWFRLWFPEVTADFLTEDKRNSAEPAFHYNLWTPVLLRRGDCIFWTTCARKAVTDLRFPEPRRPLARESRVLVLASGTWPASPRMRHTAGPFHAVQPRDHSAPSDTVKAIQLTILRSGGTWPGPNWDEAGENGLGRLKTQRLGTELRRHNVELYIAALQHCSWIPGFEFGTRSTWHRDWQRLAETLAKPEWRTSPKCCIKFSANEGRTSTPACNPYALGFATCAPRPKSS